MADSGRTGDGGGGCPGCGKKLCNHCAQEANFCFRCGASLRGECGGDKGDLEDASVRIVAAASSTKTSSRERKTQAPTRTTLRRSRSPPISQRIRKVPVPVHSRTFGDKTIRKKADSLDESKCDKKGSKNTPSRGGLKPVQVPKGKYRFHNTASALEKHGLIRNHKPPDCRIVSSGVARLVKHEQWVFYNPKLKFVKGGKGMGTLKASLTQSKCGFVVVRLSHDVDNKGVKSNKNIVLAWTGSSAVRSLKDLTLNNIVSAVSHLQPNDGYIPVAIEEKSKLTVENLLAETKRKR